MHQKNVEILDRKRNNKNLKISDQFGSQILKFINTPQYFSDIRLRYVLFLMPRSIPFLTVKKAI